MDAGTFDEVWDAVAGYVIETSRRHLAPHRSRRIIADRTGAERFDRL
jgi:hypothetical protein